MGCGCNKPKLRRSNASNAPAPVVSKAAYAAVAARAAQVMTNAKQAAAYSNKMAAPVRTKV